MADYGVDGSGTPTSYSTSAFMGEAQYTEISADAPNSTDPAGLSFQLNTNLELLGASGRSYDFWVQDVAVLNTSSWNVTFLDNVWNFSGSGAGLEGSSLTGQGSVVGTGAAAHYGANAAQALPGNDANLTATDSIALTVETNLTDDVPRVYFSYEDDLGAEVFDELNLTFATGWTDAGFVVNGSTLAPNGLYRDAEMVLGGPGNGEATNLVLGKGYATLALGFWNGANFQSVPEAYDYGGDTSERIQNAAAILDPNATLNWGSGHNPGALVLPGLGSLGLLYDSATTGVVCLMLPPPRYGTIFGFDTLAIDGAPDGTLGGPLPIGEETEVNLTLWPGSYQIGVGFYSQPPSYDLGAVPVQAGAATLVLLGADPTYRVNLTESGLPAGTPWTLHLGWSNRSWTETTTSGTVDAFLYAGTYECVATTTDPQYLAPPAGPCLAPGPGVLSFDFSPEHGVLRGTVEPGNASLEIEPGAFRLGGGTLNWSAAPGDYELNASAPGYLDDRLNFSLSPGLTTWLNVTLSELGPGAGRISRNGSTAAATLPPAWDTPAGIGLLVIGLGVGAAAGLVGGRTLARRRRSPRDESGAADRA